MSVILEKIIKLWCHICRILWIILHYIEMEV